MKEIPFEVQVALGILNKGGLYGPDTFKMINEAINEYPEYFPEIVERNRIFASIPLGVHEAYDKELKEIEDRFKSIEGPESLGIMGWIKNPDKLWDYDNFWGPKWKERDEKEESLKEKHYKAFYGDLWNGLNKY